jgi:hypothetical protein
MWWGPSFEAPDPRALAVFYSSLLEWPIVHDTDDTCVIKPPQDGAFVVFQLAEDYVPPQWPPGPGEQRTMMHLDVQVDDLANAVADAESLGAKQADYQPNPHVRVLFDPAGHPFCLCVDDEA